MRVAAAVCVLTGLCGTAQAETFDWTFDQFRKALDQRIRDDITDKSEANFSRTKDCKKTGNVYTCSFNDKGFQITVAGFKKLDLMSGRFTLKLTLTVETTEGKVSKIRLNGDRNDPVNLLQYVGTVTNVMQLFEPKIVEGEGKSLALAKDLGVMRGDADPSIGSPVDIIKPYAAIRCLNVPTRITSGVACEWVPRS